MKRALPIAIALAVTSLVLSATPVTAQRSADKAATLDSKSEEKRADESIKRLNAMLIGEYLKRADRLSRNLKKLADGASQVEAKLAVLLHNDQGKLIATSDEAVRAFMNFAESPVVSTKQVEVHQKRIEPIRQGLASYINIPRIFDPAKVSESTLLAAEEAWADTEMRALTQRNSLIIALTRLAPEGKSPDGLPTLNSRITALKSRMMQEEVEAIDQAREEARLKGIEEKANATGTRELENAKEEAAIELRMLQLELAKARADFAMIQAQKEAVIQEIEQAAEKKNLKTKLEELAVRKKLRPFTAHGYWQPGNYARSQNLKKGPMSFSAIEQFGALNSGHQGLANLLAIANKTGIGQTSNNSPRMDLPRTYTGSYINRKHIDTDRPKWSFPKDFNRYTAEQLLKVQEVQDLLIELGPTMVEEGMLAP